VSHRFGEDRDTVSAAQDDNLKLMEAPGFGIDSRVYNGTPAQDKNESSVFSPNFQQLGA